MLSAVMGLSLTRSHENTNFAQHEDPTGDKTAEGKPFPLTVNFKMTSNPRLKAMRTSIHTPLSY